MIEEKRTELLGILDQQYEILKAIVSDKSLSNPSYSKYTTAKAELSRAADKILEFNGVVHEFFLDSN